MKVWPLHTPDLNPIDQVWNIMGEKVIEKAKKLSRGWKKVKGGVKKSVVLNIQDLINNMPWRVAAVSAIGVHEKTNIYIDCTILVL